MKTISALSKIYLLWGFFLIVGGIVLWMSWPAARSLWLTRQHGAEMSQAIQNFREVEFALETRLQPDRILSVVTKDYLPAYWELNQVEMCQSCDRFWIVTSADVREVRVLDYTGSYSRVWAKVTTWGHRVDSKTHEPLAEHEAPLMDEATYSFVRDGSAGVWKLQEVQGFSVPNP